MVSIGDTIIFHKGASDGCAVDCYGEILKQSGEVFSLLGDADNGIDTGHPPHMYLKMIQKWERGFSWVSDPREVNVLVHRESQRAFFMDRRKMRPAFGDLSPERASEFATEFTGEVPLPPLEGKLAWRKNILSENSYGWDELRYTVVKPTIQKVNTDRPCVR
jgi:hypothetical protein